MPTKEDCVKNEVSLRQALPLMMMTENNDAESMLQ